MRRNWISLIERGVGARTGATCSIKDDCIILDATEKVSGEFVDELVGNGNLLKVTADGVAIFNDRYEFEGAANCVVIHTVLQHIAQAALDIERELNDHEETATNALRAVVDELFKKFKVWGA